MSAATSAHPDQVAARRSLHPGLVAVSGVFAVAVLARAAFLAWHPPLDQHVYDVADVRAHGPGTWLVMHSLVGGPGVVLALAGLSVLVGAACPGRGAVLAAVGGLLASLGGLAFCVAVGAEGVAWWYATADGVVAPEAGAAVMASFEAHPLPVDVPALAGSLAAAAGVLVLLGALWRAAAAPRWLLVGTAALALLAALDLPAALVRVQALADTPALLGLGWCALRRARALASAGAASGVLGGPVSPGGASR